MERGACIMGFVICSVKEACKLMEHMNEEDMVVLNIINMKTYVHDVPKKIQKKKGEELIKQANDIFYQNNDIFGTISLLGVLKDSNIIHSILFPQLE